MVSGERQVTLGGELAAARSAFDAAGILADLPGAVDEVLEEHRDVFAWALREGTTNVLRHAAARRVAVTLTPRSLVVDDDGRGLRQDRPAASDGGDGLPGLTDRARAVGLVVETGPSPSAACASRRTCGRGSARRRRRRPRRRSPPDGAVPDEKDTA